MSDQAKEAKPEGKKGNKLPMILVAVLVLGGGGYFMMNKGKGEVKVPEMTLGTQVHLGEMLTNLQGGGFVSMDLYVTVVADEYLKAKAEKDGEEGKKHYEHLSHVLGIGGGGGHGGAAPPPVNPRDAVNIVMSQWTAEDIASDVGRVHLKRAIALAINSGLHHEPAAEEEGEEKKKDEEHAEEGGETAHHGPADYSLAAMRKLAEEAPPEHADWDSDEGPVLQVLFFSLVTQKQ